MQKAVVINELAERMGRNWACWGQSGETIYFSTDNNKYYSEEEKDAFIRDKIFASEDFIQIPPVNAAKIKRDYLMRYYSDRSYQHWDDAKLEEYFHNNIEEQYGADDGWDKYRHKQLAQIAVEWCLEHGLNYTRKDLPWEA